MLWLSTFTLPCNMQTFMSHSLSELYNNAIQPPTYLHILPHSRPTPSIYPSTHPSACPSSHLLIHPFIIHLSTNPSSIPPSMNLCIYPIHPLTSLTHQPLIHLFIHPSINTHILCIHLQDSSTHPSSHSSHYFSLYLILTCFSRDM